MQAQRERRRRPMIHPGTNEVQGYLIPKFDRELTAGRDQRQTKAPGLFSVEIEMRKMALVSYSLKRSLPWIKLARWIL